MSILVNQTIQVFRLDHNSRPTRHSARSPQ